MKTPYNTGRVAIGIAYMPMQHPWHDADAQALQTALLARHSHRSQNLFLRLINSCWRWL